MEEIFGLGGVSQEELNFRHFANFNPTLHNICNIDTWCRVDHLGLSIGMVRIRDDGFSGCKA